MVQIPILSTWPKNANEIFPWSKQKDPIFTPWARLENAVQSELLRIFSIFCLLLVWNYFPPHFSSIHKIRKDVSAKGEGIQNKYHWDGTLTFAQLLMGHFLAVLMVVTDTELQRGAAFLLDFLAYFKILKFLITTRFFSYSYFFFLLGKTLFLLSFCGFLSPPRGIIGHWLMPIKLYWPQP